MGSRIECFWMEPTELASSELRRYQRIAYGEPGESLAYRCPGPLSYCNASIYLGDVPYPFDPQGLLGYGSDDVPHNDPHWPETCEFCHRVFPPDDMWQHNVSRYFQGAPDGKLYTTSTMPPGAMYDADWWNVPGPDGVTLTVVLPPQGGFDVWHPDSPSSNGTPWTRTGTIPKVTCTPSVLTPRYHGFLTDGWLIEC